jgi:hydroxyethylthiazole kinase-like uncharacterized protein yjeF
MLTAHSVEQVRQAEAALMARLPDGELMQRAVAGLTSECVRLLGRVYGAHVVVVAGSGDNGGDALYAAARLARRGATVEAVLLDAAKAHAGGLAALRAAGGRSAAAGEWRFRGADLVLDGVVGIGGRGGLRPAAEAVFAQIEAGRAAGAMGVGGVDDGVGGGVGPGPGPGVGERGVGVGVGVGAGVDGGERGLGRAGIGKRGHSRPTPAARRTGTGPLLVAVDLPSGVEADTGEVPGAAVRADVTVTFGTYKPGLLISPGAEYVGDLRFVDIGLAPHLEGAPVLEALEHADVEARLPVPTAESNKYRRGVVGIAAGSPRYPGAAVLCTGAALRSGVGAVRFVGEPEVCDGVLDRYPEVLIGDGRVQAWVVGPGIGLDCTDRVATVLGTDLPVLVDADGLSALKVFKDLGDLEAERFSRPYPTLITPHAGEAARLLGDPWTAEQVEAHRLAAVRELVDRYHCTVLLKGSTTLIADPAHSTRRVNRTGTPALATAGSGDVLSGLAGGLLAAGLTPFDAAPTAAWLHGQAARDEHRRHPGRQLIAGDLVDSLTAAPTSAR